MFSRNQTPPGTVTQSEVCTNLHFMFDYLF